MFVVVNCEALAQAGGFLIERRQVVFLCWMQDSNPEDLCNLISSRPNARRQTDWAIEDQAKNLNSTARPYDQRAFSPLDPIASWHSHLALVIYMFVIIISSHTLLGMWLLIYVKGALGRVKYGLYFQCLCKMPYALSNISFYYVTKIYNQIILQSYI